MFFLQGLCDEWRWRAPVEIYYLSLQLYSRTSGRNPPVCRGAYQLAIIFFRSILENIKNKNIKQCQMTNLESRRFGVWNVQNNSAIINYEYWLISIRLNVTKWPSLIKNIWSTKRVRRKPKEQLVNNNIVHMNVLFWYIFKLVTFSLTTSVCLDTRIYLTHLDTCHCQWITMLFSYRFIHPFWFFLSSLDIIIVPPLNYYELLYYSWFGSWRVRARPRRRWWLCTWSTDSFWPGRTSDNSTSWSDTSNTAAKFWSE